MDIENIVEKYITEKKKLDSLPDDVKKGILSWVKDYAGMRKAGNVKGAKEGKAAIDKEIKKYGLDSKEVYFYYGDPDKK